MSRQKITITIDRIISDDSTLDRAAVIRALRAEIGTHLQNGGTLGVPSARAAAMGEMTRSSRPIAERVAQGTVRGLKR